MIRAIVIQPDGVLYIRRRLAEELRDYSRKLDAEIRKRRDCIGRTEDKIQG